MLLSPSCPATGAGIRVTSFFVRQPLSSHHPPAPNFRLKPLPVPSSKRRPIIPRRTQFPQDHSLPIGQTRPLHRPRAANTASTTSVPCPAVSSCYRAIRLRQHASTIAPSRTSNGSKPCGKNYETKPIPAQTKQNATPCHTAKRTQSRPPVQALPCAEQRGYYRAIEKFEPLKALREELRNEANSRANQTKCDPLRHYETNPISFPCSGTPSR
jgi:hypothetical protein